MKYETFEALINIYQKCCNKCRLQEEKFEKLFDPDTTIMFYWPAEFCGKQLKSAIISEFGESSESADWFIYEGLDQIRNGGTEISLKQEGTTWITYQIESLKDAFNFYSKNYQELKSEVKENFTEEQVHIEEVFSKYFNWR